MTFQTYLLAAMAGALLVTAGPASADSERNPPRKWSQPSYDREDFSPPQAAPEMEDFPGISNAEDALFDGDGKLIDRRGRKPSPG